VEEESTLPIAFRFTAKELDSETGLYYFGARYYDPRTSVWQSADPILAKYLPTGNKEQDAQLSGMGGVINPINLAMYTYGHQNPVKFIDPDGNAVFASAQELMAAGNAVLSNPTVQPNYSGSPTWCNRGVGLIEAAGGNADSYGNGQPGQYLKANAMIEKLQDTNFAKSISAKEAVRLAKQGVTVIAGASAAGHGHVAIVAPVDMESSGSLGTDVPKVFNVGSESGMGIKKVSGAFSLTNQPKYYVRNSDLDTLNQRNSGNSEAGNEGNNASKQDTFNLLAP